MPRHSVVESSRIAFSMKMFLETAPVGAARPPGGPVIPPVYLLRTGRHRPTTS